MRTVPLPLLLAVLLAVSTLILYWPATANQFIDFDDPLYVTENSHVRQGLSWTGVAWAWGSLEEANWHPLAWISHQADAALFGTEPSAAWGHHLTSILIHALNSGLALWVLVGYTGRVWPSALVTALFAWHPLHVESVAWVSERKDVLNALFFWLTLAAYRHYVLRPQSWGRWLLVIGCLALGLSAKPMLVTTPFVLLLLDYWPLRRIQPGNDQANGSDPPTPRSNITGVIGEKFPLFVLVAASCIVTYIAQRDWGAVGSVEDIPISNRLANAALAYVGYLGNAIWPTQLAIFYPYQQQAFDAAGLLRVTVSVLALVVASTVASLPVWCRRQSWGWLTLGWFWYLGMLVPVIGLVQVGSQAMADRYTYLPLVGIFILFAWGLAALVGRWPRVRAGCIGFVVLALAGSLYATHVQIGYWQDRVTLYRHALEVTEENHLAHSNLGAALYELSLAEQSLPRIHEAAEHFRQAIAIKPQLAQAHNGLGLVHAALGEFDQAAAEYTIAYQLRPTEAKVANNLAWALATSPNSRTRQPERAVALALEACRKKDFQDPAVLDTLAAAYAAAGRFPEASRTADRAIELARQQGVASLVQSIDQRRARYRRGEIYTDTPLPLGLR